MKLKWTDVLKRKLLGQNCRTSEHDGKFFVCYDAIEVSNLGGNKLQVTLMLKGERLFEWDPIEIMPQGNLHLEGLRGEQEIHLS